ncbi:hypothetical protein C8R45DRAFT_944196 [Mycena sanguinolenta]|nr:hypothetical protein C8R45DRAFT_944196 [Mycena sanguinolenta]
MDGEHRIESGGEATNSFQVQSAAGSHWQARRRAAHPRNGEIRIPASRSVSILAIDFGSRSPHEISSSSLAMSAHSPTLRHDSSILRKSGQTRASAFEHSKPIAVRGGNIIAGGVDFVMVKRLRNVENIPRRMFSSGSSWCILENRSNGGVQEALNTKAAESTGRTHEKAFQGAGGRNGGASRFVLSTAREPKQSGKRTAADPMKIGAQGKWGSYVRVEGRWVACEATITGASQLSRRAWMWFSPDAQEVGVRSDACGYIRALRMSRTAPRICEKGGEMVIVGIDNLDKHQAAGSCQGGGCAQGLRLNQRHRNTAMQEGGGRVGLEEVRPERKEKIQAVAVKGGAGRASIRR